MHQSICNTFYPCKSGGTTYTGEQTGCNITIMNSICICPGIPIKRKKVLTSTLILSPDTLPVKQLWVNIPGVSGCGKSDCRLDFQHPLTPGITAPLLLFSSTQGILLV